MILIEGCSISFDFDRLRLIFFESDVGWICFDSDCFYDAFCCCLIWDGLALIMIDFRWISFDFDLGGLPLALMELGWIFFDVGSPLILFDSGWISFDSELTCFEYD